MQVTDDGWQGMFSCVIMISMQIQCVICLKVISKSARCDENRLNTSKTPNLLELKSITTLATA